MIEHSQPLHAGTHLACCDCDLHASDRGYANDREG